MIRWPSNGVRTGVAAVLLLASAPGLVTQRGEMDLTVETPASLAQVADRVRHVDRHQLAGALARAGLNIPPQIQGLVFWFINRTDLGGAVDYPMYREAKSLIGINGPRV